jgi:DinB family protein
MTISASERAALIDRYASGPALFKATIAKVPKEAFQWRPAPGKWSAHEVIVHCADSETNAHARIRYLVAEERPPVIQGYDQARWAQVLDYHSLPWEPALATVEAVRANTTALLQRMTDEQWARMGTHTESGTYGALDWLKTYAEHLEIHARQLERNIAAWGNR